MRSPRQISSAYSDSTKRGADEAVALADHGEDEVGVVLGQEVQAWSASPASPRPVFWPAPIAIRDWFCW